VIVHSDTIWGTNVGECRAKADESNAQMLEQNEITENAILVASRASDDWAQARMKADLEILCVEELEESHSRLCAARDTAQEQLEAEKERLVHLLSQEKDAQVAADAALAEEQAARKALEVKTAEFDFQVKLALDHALALQSRLGYLRWHTRPFVDMRVQILSLFGVCAGSRFVFDVLWFRACRAQNKPSLPSRNKRWMARSRPGGDSRVNSRKNCVALGGCVSMMTSRTSGMCDRRSHCQEACLFFDIRKSTQVSLDCYACPMYTWDMRNSPAQ
jgi:hypothetical protein